MKKFFGAHELAYDVRGEGPVLLLLHAFPFDRRIWTDNAASFSAQLRVVSFDFPGAGESPLSGAPSIADLADDAVALLDGLGMPMATVCGLSMGGYVALAMAERHPARLAGLILADTRAGADSPEGKQ